MVFGLPPGEKKVQNGFSGDLLPATIVYREGQRMIFLFIQYSECK
jgi:hypothetical protein